MRKNPSKERFTPDGGVDPVSVGRLDYDSEGLLLLTNDGDFAQAILHPSKKIPKSYLVKIKGVPEEREIQKIRVGVRLEDGMTGPAKLQKVRSGENNTWLEITIHEGRKRQLRRMLEGAGHPVLKLKRTRIDGIELGSQIGRIQIFKTRRAC